ncbi:bifunctional 2',3'-cyclic-nucleotide 2'-phosphodiesterase/3'-nucleotidase [Tabrizicola oligotrophica]|uniref:Bifunctional 2',3'-cyclic-nucleotide 2'-phosphodiesterase/3'-nucleotidase n=1 Tax=Tabrizicola oligotrophica TaxID=2710650 RepID=A0A6M0QR82_9RHOB|nr:bifunctional 2',3'-cyclic-nucleotide 2'-phosphodiesterase/3'-nucleotidase [Tabrizicola oligotrophica]NEY89886.1 bifunctional 2',3'-cyclic-nucleotide 2'-phosphodiesterase/3'-nucleotidase [Tabrizicola oligotrophica]
MRLLATSDLHAHILPWDDLADRPAPDRGLAQVASLIAQARAEVPGSLLLDNGDFLNGSPLSDHATEVAEQDRSHRHPMIAGMNRLGYDAATLGNHELSNGLGHLRRALSQAEFPVVATNLDRINPADGKRRAYLPRQILLHRVLTDQHGQQHRLVIGVLGFLPPQTALWERRHMAGTLAARGILAAARAEVPRLRRAGADLVIALSHSGLGDGVCEDADENVSAALSALDGIDAVIAGHTHQAFPGEGGGRPARPLVMPGFFGSHLGVIDLSLDHDGSGWRVAGHRTEVRPVSRRRGPQGLVEALVQTDAAIAASAAEDLAAMRAQAAIPVGECAVALHSYFALIGHSPVQTLLAEAQMRNMRRALNGKPEAALPMLVAVAPFKAGGRGGPGNYTAIPPGPLTARNIADLYIHPNSPVALRITGRELADWLERSVSLFNRIAPGTEDSPLIDPDFPAYNFDMIHGLTFRIDLSQPARFDCLGRQVNPASRRVTGMSRLGRPVAPDEEFVLVTNSYRSSGGAGFAGTEPARVVLEQARHLRRILQDHVAQTGRVAPTGAADWGFAPMPGTTVTFDTAPGAAELAKDIAGLEVMGLQPTGFLRFRLRL